MNPCKRRNCFEFFGFDFMLDEDFRTWLIEVNTNPYVGIHNDEMSDILPNVFDGLFKITLDPIFDGISNEGLQGIHEGTCWDLLYSRLRGLNNRRAITEGIYPVKELEQVQFSTVSKVHRDRPKRCARASSTKPHN